LFSDQAHRKGFLAIPPNCDKLPAGVLDTVDIAREVSSVKVKIKKVERVSATTPMHA